MITITPISKEIHIQAPLGLCREWMRLEESLGDAPKGVPQRWQTNRPPSERSARKALLPQFWQRLAGKTPQE